MGLGLRAVWLAFTLAIGSVTAAPAQVEPDPKQTLLTLTAAFQVGGPQPAFQWFSPSVFQLVYLQTGGSGRYPAIAQLGAATGAQVYGRQEFPVGPVFAVRVQHQVGAVDWYIGFNRVTNQIEYISSQMATGGPPQIAAPPIPTNNPPQVQTPAAAPAQTPAAGPRPPAPGGPQSEACKLYPAMCP